MNDTRQDAYTLFERAQEAKAWAQQVRSRAAFHDAGSKFAAVAAVFAYLALRFRDERREECSDKSEEAYREAGNHFDSAANAVFHESRGPLRGECDA